MPNYPLIDPADVLPGDEIEAFNNDMFHPFYVRAVVYESQGLWLGEWPLDCLTDLRLVHRAVTK